MSAAAKRQPVESAGAFVPGVGQRLDWQSGEPRKIAAKRALLLRWPKTMAERRNMFAAWHKIAMKTVGDAKASFRVMALVERFLHWKTGTFWATNETLADRAGECAERTIKRDMAAYRDLGLFIIEHDWRKTSGGKLVKCRLVRLAIPEDISPDFQLPEEADHGDTSCPYEYADDGPDHGDTSCPDHGDTSCPFTYEGPMKRSGTDAA